MSKIAVVYWSGTGNTEAMAHLVAEGISSAGSEAELIQAANFSAALAQKYPSIAFGCPSMGSEQLEEMDFAPMFEAVKAGLSGKNVVLFGSYGWGDGEWMRNWAADCDSSGCRMAADPLTVNGAPEGADAEACKALGVALANA